MKKILIVATAMMMLASVSALATDEKKEAAKPVTLTGEVLDMYCFTSGHGQGVEHAKCATSCIKKGIPAGFLADDGTVYLLIGKDHGPVNALVADFAGKKSTIVGVVKENKGVKGIELVSIAEAK